MCLITEEIASICNTVPESEQIYEDWNRHRMKILETMPFEKIQFALTELDQRFQNICDHIKDYYACNGDT